MHLCRGNCLSQVLPGTFIVSPDTEYSTPLSSSGTVCSLPSSREGASLAGRGFGWVMRVGAVPPTPHLKMRRLRPQARAQRLLSAWTTGTPTYTVCTFCPANSLVLDSLLLPLPLYKPL